MVTLLPETLSLRLIQTFVVHQLDSQELLGIVTAWQSGLITHQTALFNAQRSDLLPKGKTIEQEEKEAKAEAKEMMIDIKPLQEPPKDNRISTNVNLP